jgi:hypothetical protein
LKLIVFTTGHWQWPVKGAFMQIIPFSSNGLNKVERMIARTLLGACYILTVAIGFEPRAQTFDSIPPMRAVVPNSGSTRPVYAPIWAPLYELSANSIFPPANSQFVETSLYEPYNDFTRGWWDNIVEEFTYAGINNTMILTRANQSGPGRQIDSLRSNLIPAMKQAGVYGQIKFGEFEDCGAWSGCYSSITGGGSINWADTTTMIKMLWDYGIKRFYDWMPRELWFHYNGRPMWMGWGSGGSNMSGNISKVLLEVKRRFKATYGEDLFMIVDQSWFNSDATVRSGGAADAYHTWFCGKDINPGFSFTNWNNYKIGVCVPGLRGFTNMIPNTTGCNILRGNGAMLRKDFDLAVSNNVNVMIEEGFVDMRESAGIYRSPKWDFPSQYLEIVREFNDLRTESRRFQAEACDSFNNQSNTNTGGSFSSRKLDVWAMPAPNYGWYVGGTDVGDWLLWKAPYFASGTYDVYMRYASSSAANITISIGGKTDNVSLPSTSGAFQGKKIITSRSLSGTNDIKLTMQTAGMQVDLLHFNRMDVVPVIRGADARKEPFSGIKMSSSLNGARIDYAAPFENSVVNMNIFTSTGRIVWQYHAAQSGKGQHSVDLAASAVVPGGYIVNWNVTNKNSNEFVSGSNRVMILAK